MSQKKEQYKLISQELLKFIGGKENVQGVAHCATRLRLILDNNDRADLKAIYCRRSIANNIWGRYCKQCL